MDISDIVGEELAAVEFVQDFLQLRFDGPLFTFYAWPHILLSEFSIAFGEPEYRNALCSLIGEKIDEAALDHWDDYSKARNKMLAETHTADAPWTVVKSNDKKRARINAMRHLLSKFDYDDKDHDVATEPDPQIVGRALED